MNRVVIPSIALSLSVAVLAAACGGGTSERASPSEGQPPSDQVIEVSMGDNFFLENDLTVPAGQRLTISLNNEGRTVHNLRIAGPDGQYDTSDDLVSEPDVITSDEEGILSVGLEPGLYIFRCDFHPVEMVGQIAVQ